MMISNRPFNTVAPVGLRPQAGQALPVFQLRGVKFGAESGAEKSKPMSWNPFVLLFTGIKNLYQRFSQTRLGKWFNGILQKINNRLQASKKAPRPTAPASPPPPPEPSASPGALAVQDQPQASQLAAPAVEPSASPAPENRVAEQPQPPPAVQAVEPSAPPVPAPEVAEPPQPVIKNPPYSQRSLPELEQRFDEYRLLESKWKAKQENLQSKLKALNKLREKEAACLESLRRDSITVGEKHLKSEVEKAISLLDEEIKTLSEQTVTLKSGQGQLAERIPLIEYWINFRKKLAT